MDDIAREGGLSMSENDRAAWTTAYINDLPDSSFLYIEDGGSKDSDGKTTPRSLRHFPYKDAAGAVDLPHLRNALSRIPQSNLADDVKARLVKKAQGILDSQKALPREGLVRAQPDGLEYRAGEDGHSPVLSGHFAVFDEWTEVNSLWEGRFMERIAPGAFTKTIQENRDRMRVLFQHGKDPMLGDKPLGKIRELAEEERGAAYTVDLFDGIPDLVVAGLRAGQYGSSFRFTVTKEDFDRQPDVSDFNPEGLPERVIREARVSEFGPVTFPAYPGATAGVRSLTDQFVLPDHLLERFAVDLADTGGAAALHDEGEPGPLPQAAASTPAAGSRSTRPFRDYLNSRTEVEPWRL